MGDTAVVRVPDEISSCVLFLCVRDEYDAIRFGGTAFYVAVRSEDGEHGWGYLVTARHNVVNAERYPDLMARANLTSGGTEYFSLPSSWEFHENDASDVAVLRLPMREDVELYPVPNSIFATSKLLKERRIGPGDEVIVTGLFTEHTGQERNAAIVRSGIIAAMSNEPLQDQRSGLDYQGYLVEMRSFGGLSGSPVFVRLDPGRPYGGVPDGRRYYLLGVLRGHWNYAGPVQFPQDESDALNMGIAIVTPIADVLDILFSEEEVRRRRQQEREFKARKT
jgi:hypothetical protein